MKKKRGASITSNESTPTQYVLPSWGNGAPELNLALVGKWEQTLNKGPDFDVHWFSSKSLGGSLGIYVGHHPQPIEIVATTTKANIRVGNQQIEFCVTPIKGGQKAAAIIDNFYKGCTGPGVEFLKLHIMVNSTKPDFMESVQQGLKTLQPRKIANNAPKG